MAYHRLKAIPGVSVQQASGSLYLFPRLDPEVYPIKDDEQFALDLLRQQRILVTQGTGFNWPNPDHFRLVFLPGVNLLNEALDRIEEYLEGLRERGIRF